MASAARVLVVGMADSVHLARWLTQFTSQDATFRVFSSSPHRRIHPQLKSLLDSQSAKFEMSWISRRLSLILWLVDRLLQDRLRAWLLRRELRNFGPDLLHAVEIQNAGYITERAFRGSSKSSRVPILVTNYGSDLYWFTKFEKHLQRITLVLGLADYYSAECERDVRLAKHHGFKGVVMPVIPNAGGQKTFSSEYLCSVERKSIAIKGYQNKWGRAKVALAAVEACSELLAGYRIEVFSCNNSTIRAARAIERRTALKIETHKKNKLSHDAVQRILLRSRAYIGLSMSDGISTTLLEAMNAGAIPIQSNTACIEEWIVPNKTGFSVLPEDESSVTLGLKKILSDTVFCDQARLKNIQVIRERASERIVKQVALKFYSAIIE